MKAGLHDFEYYHAATGVKTMMVVAWAMAPHNKNDRPALLPPEWFEAESIVRVEPSIATTRAHRLVPDFDYRVLGDVPLPDAAPMIGVTFRNRSLPAVMNGAKTLWGFGDGQTSSEVSPSHVYLRSGEYRVSLSAKRGSRSVTTANRVQVDRPYRDRRTKEKAHTLDEYLPILTQYDPKTLDASSARQLALAYQWKAQEVRRLAQLAAEKEKQEEQGSSEPSPGANTNTSRVRRLTEKQAVASVGDDSEKWLARAVDVGLANIKADPKTKSDDRATFELALLTGSIARFDLGNAGNAMTIYRNAAEKIGDRKLRAECWLQAADIAINELLDRKAGRSLLAKAETDLGLKELVSQIESSDTLKIPPAKPNKLRNHFFRVLGDYAASLGKGPQAVNAYQAAAVTSKTIAHTRDTAQRGAYSRSTEQFLKDHQLDRAAREIAAWCDQFPNTKIDGYFTLLYARLLFARDQFSQAIAQCDQLSAVNPEAPYLDRLLLIAAESQQRLGHPERATAILQELIDAHPGSPLVPEAKRRLQKSPGTTP